MRVQRKIVIKIFQFYFSNRPLFRIVEFTGDCFDLGSTIQDNNNSNIAKNNSQLKLNLGYLCIEKVWLIVILWTVACLFSLPFLILTSI